MRLQRGFSLAEMLTVLVIVGLVMGVIAFAMPLLLKGPAEAQSQVDNVNSAALALYRMQRDTRPSSFQGVFSCTTPTTCATPAPLSPLPPAQALVLLTADDGFGHFQLVGGSPSWTGFVVYWLTPNADNSSNELRRAFVQTIVNIPLNLGPPDAVLALNTAMLSPGYTTVAQDVRSMAAAFDSTTNTVDLQIDGGDLKGNKSSLTLSGNSYVRN